MPQQGNWIWDDINKVWVKQAGTAGGAMSIHAIVEELNDIEDVNVPAPTDGYILYWNDGLSQWECKATATPAAHKNTHDPEDGADPLDSAAPVKVGAANAIGNSHSLSRANHVHEREHAKYTDANAVDAMGAIADGNPLNHNRAAEWGDTEHDLIADGAPHHASVHDLASHSTKAHAELSDAPEDAHHTKFTTTEHTTIADGAPHHAKYTDNEAKTQAEGARLDDHAVPEDNTDLDAAAGQHGLMPKLDKIKLDTVDTDADVTGSSTPQAHKDLHDPQDGADPLDTAEPVKIAAANAIGNSHSLSRANHVHEREHAKYTDANATDAMGAEGDANALNHAKYTDAEAVSAMGAIADGNPLNHNRAAEWGTTEHEAVGDGSPHHTKYTNAEAVDAIEADGNLPVASITFIIDGGGEVISTGLKGALEIPFACTINRVTLLADQSGSIQIDIWKQAYADYPPEVGQSIVAAAPPAISGTVKSQDNALSGWTIAIAAGDCLKFNVQSITSFTWVTLSLKVTKT